jgi:putative transposase
MPRKPRWDIADAIHHVYPRGNNRQDLFRDDADCQVFLVILRGVIAVYEWHVLAYCLMTNHLHLLVEAPSGNLGDGMRRLLGHYARFFNRRYDRVGHVFGRPYKSTLVADQDQLADTVSYIALNPVAAGLCSQPEDWRHSSYGEMIGARARPIANVARALELLRG